jgi:hypothetical protein
MGENPVRRRYAIHSLAAARRASVLRVKTPGRTTASVQCSAPPRTPRNAHIGRYPSLLWGSRTCGERRAKSSAISFIVTNRTPG